MLDTDFLKKKAIKIRIEVLDSIYKAGKGHIGSTYSCCEILVSLYYGRILKFNPKDPNYNYRDRFILSKGHACLALYSIFYDMGVISKPQFLSYGKNGGLGGQLDININGVDFNTGSLGHSIGVGAGMALAGKLNNKNYKVFTLIGDSELYEGSSWESIIFAGDWKINNLIVIIDRNKFMVTDRLEDGAIYKNLHVKIKSMGWDFFEIGNGHNFSKISSVLSKASDSKKPAMIIAHTVKGKGVSFMENGLGWYTQVPSKEEYLKARKELVGKI